jgi:hypothetical protein
LIESDQWFGSQITKFSKQKKFRNWAGARASKRLSSKWKSVYLGCFALPKRDNQSNYERLKMIILSPLKAIKKPC